MIRRMIIRLVVRKLQKNMEPEEIADILEEDVEKIQKIVDKREVLRYYNLKIN